MRVSKDIKEGASVAPAELREFITSSIKKAAKAAAPGLCREPLVAFVNAHDKRFRELRDITGRSQLMPDDLLRGARGVVSFFLPFDPLVVGANARIEERAAPEWAEAYLQMNALITEIGLRLVRSLADRGVRAAAEPPTDNFDPDTLTSRWSHKSIAVMAGLGTFGLHYQVITDAGCAGRFGSLVVDADLSARPARRRERCLFFLDGSCQDCVARCPVGALDEILGIDKQRCWRHCLENARVYAHLGRAEVCGKCATGPCALASPVPEEADW